MSNPLSSYFHSASLRTRYTDELNDALKEKRIDAQEQSWLLGVASPRGATDPDPVRVDRLLLDDGAANPFELAAALLLSHTDMDVTEVYLYTLAGGIETFDTREALSITLASRYAPTRERAQFEFEKLR